MRFNHLTNGLCFQQINISTTIAIHIKPTTAISNAIK
uniref:Uncharacterized protein n=1 Tax=Parascaris equorum TaxID=6256 RepID=A0A914RDK0_PAREQ